MKSIFPGLIFLASAALLVAATNSVDKVQAKDGKVIVQPGGQVLLPPNEITLPFNIVVKTNATFSVGGGKQRVLREGESIDKGGMLTRPDGTVVPVMDHVTFNRNRVLVVKDGEASEPTSLVILGDGTSISPDGKITPRNSAPRRLLDGEVFQLQGSALPTRDTITMQGGAVKVQKDGTLLTVPRDRSVMMNDGTKVFGDGRIVKAGGVETKVSEGQIITLEGVVTRPR
jgi:hypothetical protein